MKKIIKNNKYILKLIHNASPSRIITTLLVMLGNSLTNFLIDIYLLKHIITGIETGADFYSILLFLIGLLLYQLIFYLIWNYYNEIYLPLSDQKIRKHLMNIVFSKSISVELACYENKEFYDQYTKSVQEATVRAGGVLNSLSSLLCRIFMIFSISLMFILIDPILLVFALLPFIMSLIFGKRLNKLSYNFNMEFQEKSRIKNYVNRVFYLREYAKELRTSNINRVMMSTYSNSIREIINTIKKYRFKLSAISYILTLTKEIVVFLGVICYCAFRTVVSMTMRIGDCLAVINSINSVSWSMREIADIIMEFNNHSLYIDNFINFIEYNPKIVDKPNAMSLPKINSVLTLNNISFRYDGADDYTLKNIDFSIKPGERIAIVGNNGAGKTTLVKLLMRLYDPTEGSVLYDGMNISDYKLDEYRKNIGVVFQDCKLFALNVLDNVLLRDNYSEQEIMNAIEGLKLTGIYDKINNLPNGYHSILSKEFDNNGEILSQGESQKIVLARVFSRKCNLVILDEPSSSLDPLAEYELFNNMLKVCENKTVIFISHRLSSAVLSDRILYMSDGKIIEEGTHEKLLSIKGEYYNVWNKQAINYREEADVV